MACAETDTCASKTTLPLSLSLHTHNFFFSCFLLLALLLPSPSSPLSSLLSSERKPHPLIRSCQACLHINRLVAKWLFAMWLLEHVLTVILFRIPFPLFSFSKHMYTSPVKHYFIASKSKDGKQGKWFYMRCYLNSPDVYFFPYPIKYSVRQLKKCSLIVTQFDCYLQFLHLSRYVFDIFFHFISRKGNLCCNDLRGYIMKYTK